MPSKLRYYQFKPRGMPKSQWKGAGLYYKRTKSRWSKWSKKRDLARGGKVGLGPYRYRHDSTTHRRRRR